MTSVKRTIVTTVNKCAACGERHENLLFTLKANFDEEMPYQAVCPKTGIAIYMAVSQESKQE